MVFQEIVDSVQSLSIKEQDRLIELIHQQREQQRGDNIWNDFQTFRATDEIHVRDLRFMQDLNKLFDNAQPDCLFCD